MVRPGYSGDLPAVFPDWSPYQDLESAARAYLRDPDLALAALDGVLAGAGVLGFTLERYVNDVNGVWQEAAVCDGSRLILWHGEDMAPDEGPTGADDLLAADPAAVGGHRGRRAATAAAHPGRRTSRWTRSTCTSC